MKLAFAGLLAALALGAFAVWADDVEATGNCQPTMPTANSCQGNAATSRSEGSPTPAARCFYLKTTTTLPTCTGAGGLSTTNLVWELDAGACQTVRYYDIISPGAVVPPAAPNLVTLQAYFDDTGTLIKSWQSGGAEPANGASFTFCATTDGNAGSPARAGSVSLFVRAQKTGGNGLPGNVNYDVRSNGATADEAEFDNGFLRARTFVSDIAASSPPSGSAFAYGPAGDESVTVTASFTPYFADANRESSFTSVLDEATLAIGGAAATVEVDAASLAQSQAIDATFPFSGNPYVAGWTIAGNAFHGLRHTTLAATGHCATCVKVSDTFIYNSADIAIDPRVVLDSDGAGTFATADDQWVNRLNNAGGAIVSKYNRAENAYTEGYVFNARDQQLTRPMTFSIEDAGAVNCVAPGSLTPTAGKYSTTYVVPSGGSCAVANTDAGSPRYLRVTNTDQNHLGVEDHTVSSLLYLLAHTRLAAVLDPLAPSDLAFFVRSDGAGGDDSDTWNGACRVLTVRQDVAVDTSGNAVTLVLKDPTTTTRASLTTDTGADGWTPTVSLLASTPLGTWPYTCTATFAGNTGTATENPVFGVEGGGGGETIYTGVDPMTVNTAWKEGYLNQTNLVTITARFLDGSARLDAEDEMLVTVECGETAVVEDENPEEWGGGIYELTFPGHGVAGDCQVVVENTDPVTMGGAASNAFSILNVTGNASTAEILAQLQAWRSEDEANNEAAAGQTAFWMQTLVFGGLAVWSIFRMSVAGLRWLGVTTFSSVGLVLTFIDDVTDLPAEAWPRSLSMFMVWVAAALIAILAARHVHRNRRSEV